MIDSSEVKLAKRKGALRENLFAQQQFHLLNVWKGSYGFRVIESADSLGEAKQLA
jgi:hypothetical protein